MNKDFSQVNLQYLIQARDLTQQDPQLGAIFLGISDEMAYLLADLSPQQLAQMFQIKSPLLIPRQEAWWWSRLYTATLNGRLAEIEDVKEYTSLIVVP